MLRLIEAVVEKVPIVDSINDAVQTVERTASCRLVFASVPGAETIATPDSGESFASAHWVPLIIGAGNAVVVHLLQAGGQGVPGPRRRMGSCPRWRAPLKTGLHRVLACGPSPFR